MKDVENCCILNNFYWCVWAIMMAKEEEECDPTIFNWEFCRQRCILVAKQREWFGYSAKAQGEKGSDGLVLSETIRAIEKY